MTDATKRGLRITCAKCGKGIRLPDVPEDHLPRRGKCSGCGEAIDVHSRIAAANTQVVVAPSMNHVARRLDDEERATIARDAATAAVAAMRPVMVHAPAAPVSQSVVVHAAPASGNSAAIACVVFGALAILLCWIPFVNIIAVILGIIGLVFGALGIIMSLMRGGKGLVSAVAGGILCVIAVAVPVAMYGSVAAAAAAAEKGREARRSAEERGRTTQLPPSSANAVAP